MLRISILVLQMTQFVLCNQETFVTTIQLMCRKTLFINVTVFDKSLVDNTSSKPSKSPSGSFVTKHLNCFLIAWN